MILNKTYLDKNLKDIYNYRQDELSAGIVHFGVGNFHRSHQALYLDSLFNQRQNLNFGIIGAGLREQDKIMANDLQNQDYLSTIISSDNDNENIRINTIFN